MLKINKSTNITGQSIIDVTEGEGTVSKQVAYMNANVQENDQTVNINKSIQNSELFNENKEAVLADFKEFEDIVYGLLK